MSCLVGDQNVSLCISAVLLICEFVQGCLLLLSIVVVIVVVVVVVVAVFIAFVIVVFVVVIFVSCGLSWTSQNFLIESESVS